MLDAFFAGTLGEGHSWIVDVDDGSLCGIAYFAPERMATGTWNLYLIGVRPDVQRRGRGSSIVAWIEADLANRGERILLVETSGLPKFAATRAFYHRNRYDREACFREFYAPSDDKIVFRKALRASR